MGFICIDTTQTQTLICNLLLHNFNPFMWNTNYKSNFTK